MCRDNTLFYDLQGIYSYYEIADLPELDFEPIFHDIGAGPTKWPIVINKDDSNKVIAALWGFIPFYAKTRKEGDSLRGRMVNARQETILSNNTFKYALAKNRCIIPSTGFFEHHHEISGKRKMPFLIKQKHEKLFSMAGVYNNWVDKETGEIITSFAILTTSANELMEKIHNGGENPHRMPLMLTKEQAIQWLQAGITDDQLKEILEYKIPAADLTAHAVYTIRGKNKLTGPEILEPYTWEGYSLELGCD